MIMPLVNILIFTLVFSKIMGARMDAMDLKFSEYSYSIYLIIGVLSWNSFANTLQRTTSIFHDKAGLIVKVDIDLRTLPVYILMSEAAIFVISMLFFAGFLLVIGYSFTAYWLLIPAVYITQQLLAYAVGFGLAVLNIFIRDIKELMSVVLQLWFWLTPIVYAISMLPESVQGMFKLNPFYVLLQAYRDLIMYQKFPDIDGVSLIFLIGLVVMGFSSLLYTKLEKDLRDFI